MDLFVSKNDWLRSIYVFIYLFHMPMFVFVSGYFVKAELTAKEIVKTVNSVCIPYIIFQLIQWTISGDISNIMNYNMLNPGWTLWYLQCLFFWRLLTPFLIKIPFILPLSFSFAIGCGFIEKIGIELSLSKTIVFLPFFLLGFFFRKNKYDIKRIFSHKVLSVLLIILFFCLSVKFRWIDKAVLLNNSSYYFQNNIYEAVLYRLFYLIIAFTLGLSVLSLIPDKILLFSKIGRRTLIIYLTHPLLFIGLQKMGFYNYFQNNDLYFILIPIGVLVTFLLSTDIVEKVMNPIIYPMHYIKQIIYTPRRLN